MNFMLLLTVTVVKVLSAFVDRDEYEAKVAAIPSMEQRHGADTTGGWQYRRIAAGNGDYTHRYYYHPSEKPVAPVLLCIHGLNLNGRTFRYFAPLAKQWQLIAYDLPDRCPLYTAKFSDWQVILDDFLAQIPDSVVAVAGVSFGGTVALSLAANSPRVAGQRLVLISTTMANATPSLRSNSDKMADWVRTLPDHKVYWFIETMVERSQKKLADEALPGRDVRDAIDMKHPDFYRQVALSIKGYDAREDAARLRGPVLMLMGEKDHLLDPEQERLFRTHIPQVEYETVSGGTHSMAYLRGEELAGRIALFCRQSCRFTWME